MPKKTAAIYNRWLFTLGGGEQVTFAYAEALRDLGYATTILTHKKVDLEKAITKMNINLDKISVQYLPLVEPSKLSQFSEKYDVFINTSYLDYFPNRCKKGILSVFFPGEIYLTPFEYLKRRFILPSLQNFFIYPTQFEGFVSDSYHKNRMHKWLGRESSIYFNQNNSKKVELALHAPTFAFSTIESLKFFINHKAVKPQSKKLTHTENVVRFNFVSQTAIKKITIQKPAALKQSDISLVTLEIPSVRYLFYNWFKTFFPKWEMRLHGGPGITPLSDLSSYKKIVTISKFCQTWIQRYWGLPSTIVYPPVNISAFAPAQKKKNYIVHIGRFFVTGHSKKQLDLIKVFNQLVAEHNVHDWELHLVGTVHEGEKHKKYYEACLAEARGSQVHFHIGVPFSQLKKILSEAKLYWHATGLDQDQHKEPVLMEHFGITTVEAMAAGCVPLVINAGGQPEIVKPGTGFVWNTREQLIQYTMIMIKNPHLLKKYGLAARNRSHNFSRENFKKRFASMLKSLD
ncbi:MAG: glycosyltransferase family 4 protein [Patescibacteria group bacterium]